MKTIVTIIILVAITLGAYYWYASQSATPSETPNAQTVDSTSGSSALPTGAQTSDQALNTDLGAIDSQLSGLGTDTTNVSQSINDTQVTQAAL